MVFLFTVVTSPFVVLFGPFNNVKRAVIGAILQSRHPHYITWLFNEEELQSILGTVGVVKSAAVAVSFFLVKVKTVAAGVTENTVQNY